MKEKYCFGSKSLKLEKGTKKNNDYVIYWDDILKFDDKQFFQQLLTHIKNFSESEKFIKLFCNIPLVTLGADCIETNFTKDTRSLIHEHISSLSINDDCKVLLFSMVLRCDIDNLNYNCPRFNGCVRHFVQVLLLLGYKYSIQEWKQISEIRLPNNDIIAEIFNIGFPNNSYGFDTNEFKSAYRKFKNKR